MLALYANYPTNVISRINIIWNLAHAEMQFNELAVLKQEYPPLRAFSDQVA
jgi:hypothetical protein